MSLQPIPTEDWTEKLLEGCGAWLAELEVVTFSATADYTGTAERPPLFVNGMKGSPDRAVALTVYPVDDDAGLSDVVVGLQFISRGSPNDKRSALRLDDRLYNVLHGATGLTWGGVPVVVVARRSGASLGQDGNRRYEQVSNYWATAARPSRYRVD